MNIFQPCGILCEVLFAAGWDFLETLLPFLFVGFWILSQVFSVFRFWWCWTTASSAAGRGNRRGTTAAAAGSQG